MCAVTVYLRLPFYASWSTSHSSGCILRVLLAGVTAGISVGLIVLVFPFTGEPTMASMHIADILTWLAVLAAVGAVNAAVVYGRASVAPKGGSKRS